jgi:hypothetical protein
MPSRFRRSMSRCFMLASALICTGFVTRPATAQIAIAHLQPIPSSSTLEAALSIADGTLPNTSGGLHVIGPSTMGAPKIATIDSGSFTRLAVVLKPTSFSLGAANLVHRIDESMATPMANARMQFAIAKQTYQPSSVSSDRMFRPAAPHRATGARRAVEWMLNEAIGDDGVRQLKQSCSIAKRLTLLGQ